MITSRLLVVSNLTPKVYHEEQNVKKDQISRQTPDATDVPDVAMNNNKLEEFDDKTESLSDLNNIEPMKNIDVSNDMKSLQTFAQNELDIKHEIPRDDYIIHPTGVYENFDWLFGDVIDGEHVRQNIARFRDDVNSSIFPRPNVVYPEDDSKSISPTTYNNLISLFSESLNTMNCPLNDMEHYFKTYWLKFNIIYPIVHYHTTDVNKMNLYLLASILSIGMAMSRNQEAYNVSIGLRNQLRTFLYKEITETVKASLSLTQALLLDHFYSKMLGDCKHSRISQLFHGTAIGFLRISGYFDEIYPPDFEVNSLMTPSEMNMQWRNWVFFETRKRISYFGFILDSQHSSLFRHTQLLSIFEIQMDLPSSDALWEADCARTFISRLKMQPKGLLTRSRPCWEIDTLRLKGFNKKQEKSDAISDGYHGPSMTIVRREGEWPGFLWSLRRLMQPYKEHQKEYSLECFSQFSRLILLHGLMSISWDLNWRGLFDLGFVSRKKLGELSDRLVISLFNWRGYYDTHITMTNMTKNDTNTNYDNEDTHLNDYNNSILFWSNMTMYYLSNITLHVDLALVLSFFNDYISSEPTEVFEIYLKKLATHDKYENKREMVEKWAESIDGRMAEKESAKLLKLILNNEELVEDIPHAPWSVYVPCLIIWCFEKYLIPNLSDFKGGSDQRDKSRFFEASERSFLTSKENALRYLTALSECNLKVEVTYDASDEFSYWERQQCVYDVIFLSRHLLEKCMWANVKTLRDNFDRLLQKVNQ